MRRAGVGNAVQGEYGLPHQRARWFAMTGYREVRRISGGGVWSPRPTEGLKCLRRGVGDAVPHAGQDDFHKKCHSEEHSDVGIRFSRVAKVQRRGITDCHTSLRAGSQ